MKQSIITHNGVFHADEVLAIALLTVVNNTTYNIIRTREIPLDANYIIDVGGQYDGIKYFDHHQADYKGKLSSVGMIWKYLQKTCKPSFMLDKLVAEVDAQDVGIKLQSWDHFSQVINSMNAKDIHSEDQTNAFNDALRFAELTIKASYQDVSYTELSIYDKLLTNMIKAKAEAERRNAERVESLQIQDYGLRLVFLDKHEEYLPTVALVGIADILIQWDKQQEAWTVSNIAKKAGAFESDYKLSATGRASEVFCHKAGFIGKYKTEEYFQFSDPAFSDAVIFKVNGRTIAYPLGEEYFA